MMQIPLTPADFQAGDTVWVAPLEKIEEVKQMTSMNDKFYSNCRKIAGKPYTIKKVGTDGVTLHTYKDCQTDWTISKKHIALGILCKKDPAKTRVTLDEGLFTL